MQVLLSKLNERGEVESEILDVFDCEAQTSGGVKATCLHKRLQKILLDEDFNDLKEWCSLDRQNQIVKDRPIYDGLLPAEFRAGFIDRFNLKEEYAKFVRMQRDEL